MKTKALKLPDGGTLDLSIPTDFGSPILALNDAASIARNPFVIYGVGAAAGLFVAYLFLRMTKA